ncbi:MAG: hypothetical protein WC247_14455 [Porticoccaceae bacterium]
MAHPFASAPTEHEYEVSIPLLFKPAPGNIAGFRLHPEVIMKNSNGQDIDRANGKTGNRGQPRSASGKAPFSSFQPIPQVKSELKNAVYLQPPGEGAEQAVKQAAPDQDSADKTQDGHGKGAIKS